MKQKLHTVWQRANSVRIGLLLAAVFTMGFLLGSQYNPIFATQVSLSAEEEQEFEAFWQAYDLLRARYLDPLDTHAVVEGAISGMLDSVGDQYTGYMFSEVYSLMNEDISGEIQGIGVIIRTVEDTGLIEVANVLKDTPAERAGVRNGDIFLTVDGEDVRGYTQLELAGIVRGPRGSLVDITFLREDDTVELSIERDRIPIPTAEYALLEDEIAYIRLFEFNPQSRPQVEEALNDLGSQAELSGMILDLRGNPGGTLDSSIEIASAFVEDEVLVLEEFADRNETLRTDGSFLGLEIPVVILVDEASASASELVSGALQDHEAATIIGETTFGKGTVQIWQGLSNGGGVRITIARWLTPDGNWIHEQGISPDIEVDWDPEGGYVLDINDEDSLAGDRQLQAAIGFLLDGTIPQQTGASRELSTEAEPATTE